MSDGLVLRDVTIQLGQLILLHRESISIARGETLVITGENGAGKSTLMYVCAGLVSGNSGTVTLNGHLLHKLKPSELVHRGVRRGFVFQQGGLVANLSALGNVELPLRYHADVLALSEDEIEERARRCLREVGVDSPDIHSLPGRLSFGLRKRVAFARAMAIEPNFAFFDDPDSGLDRETQQLVHAILVRYRDDPEVSMVVATNHRALIERLGLAVHELIGGELVKEDLDAIPDSSPLV